MIHHATFLFPAMFGCVTAVGALVASLVISVAGTAATLTAQAQAAGAQEDYQKQVAKQRNQQFIQEAEAARTQEAQQNEALARRNFQAVQANREAEATARVAAGDAGAEGPSVQALLRDYHAQEARFLESTARQQQLSSVGFGQNLAIERTRVALGNTASNSPIQQPNYIGEAANLGSRSLGAYSNYLILKRSQGGNN